MSQTVRFSGWLFPARPSVEELAAEIQAALQGGAEVTKRTVVVEVDVPPVQRRLLRDLPPMGRRDLRALANHQASRFFRTADSGLIVDAQWLRGPTEPRVAVAAALDAGFAADLITAAAIAGTTVADILPRAEGVPPGLSLLPTTERSRRTRAAWKGTLRTAVATAAFAGLVGGIVLWRQSRAATEIAAELVRLRGPAEEVRLARQQMDSVAGMVATIRGAQVAGKQLAARIALVASALPDSAVLTSLEVGRDGGLQLSGLALEPFLVAGLLQRTNAFSTARLDGSPNPEAAGGRNWSRFAIRIEKDTAR